MTSEEKRFGVVRVVNRAGLHARAATELAKLVRRFEATIHIWKGDSAAEPTEAPNASELVDCRDVLQVLSLGAAPGAWLHIMVQGPGSDELLETVTQFFAGGCGEEAAEGDLPSDAP